MTVTRSQVLKLYRSSLQAAQQFETYNFRKYFYRRTRDRFRASSTLTEEPAIAQAVAEARQELAMMQRQGLVNKMFSHNRVVIESDPKYASGTRRNVAGDLSQQQPEQPVGVDHVGQIAGHSAKPGGGGKVQVELGGHRQVVRATDVQRV
ncbi:hypothetical protein EC988_006689, partial [Linderina pennispora]